MIDKKYLQEKISNLPDTDLNLIVKFISLNKKNYTVNDIVDYISNSVSSTGIINSLTKNKEKKVSFSLQNFFVDTIQLFFILIKDDTKIISKYNLSTNNINKFLQLIDDNKYKITDDFCITLVSRLFLIFNNYNENLHKQIDIKNYYSNNIVKINDIIISILKKKTSLFSNKIIEKNSGSRIVEQVLQDTISSKFLMEFIKENPEQCFNLKKLIACWRLIPFLGLAIPTVLIAINTYKKYNNLISNKKYINILYISLLVYEDEYINYKIM